eukprot:TRINITY_DN1304_c5_g1_i1.p1 TRINITY_DN1304_c5_g1~~TRINITY_DN1304_c5_g1_i1.p1  ORF type:complete len:207 (+),score=21.59 TRINITY_DN1304_c5_g1_i1:56-676(+)
MTQPGYSAKPYPSAATGRPGYVGPMNINERRERQEGYTAKWEVHLLLAGFYQPQWFLGGCFCFPCTAFIQRRTLLMVDRDQDNWQYYRCCGGMCAPCCTEKMTKLTTGRERFCLAVETCCCPDCAVRGNRFLMQTHYGLENTCFDKMFFALTLCCGIWAADCLEHVADVLFRLFLGCCTAQIAHEMDVKGYPQGHYLDSPAQPLMC